MGYFRAKLAQENLIKASGIPYTIVHATQFFEFLGAIAQSATEGQTVRLPSSAFQPMAAEDVAAALTDVALGEPLNDTVEVAGPERTGLDEFVRRFLRGTKDPREVITDGKARYFGVAVNNQTLVPGLNPRIGPTFFKDWLSRSMRQNQTSSAGSAPKSSRPSPGKSALGLIILLCGIAFTTPSVSAGSNHDASNEAKVTLVYEHVLPNVPGKSIKGVLVEYQPGGSSPAHTHPASAFICATVLEGAIRSQVNDGPVKVYHASESFSEMPGDHHAVSANASETEPARLLAVFVVDTDEKNLTTNDTK
jgi:quercetin dioxygenase-like cupin family protein